MIVKPSQLVTVQFNVNPSTGVADADSLPAGNVSHDGVADGAVTVTVTDRGTGKYSAAFTVPASGYDPGEFLALEITATVGGLNWAQSWNFQVDTSRASDLATTIGAAGAGLTALGDARLANLDAAVSSRSTYAGGAVASVTGAVGSVAAGGITAASIATGAIDADALASDAVAEIQAGLSTLTAAQVNTEADTALADAGVTSTRMGYLTGPVATAAKLLRYIQLTLRKDSAVATDLATELGEINANTGTGTGGYLSTTDSQEASRDAISAGSASAADIAAELGGMGYTVVDADSVTATAISKRRGDVWTIALTDLGALGTWTKLWFTIKTGDTGDADTDAKVQILLTNPTAGTDGLQRLNGAAGTAAQGGIVVDDSATGDITVTVASAATTQLAVRSDYVFDVQILRAAGTTTLAYGTFTVRSDVTRAVS